MHAITCAFIFAIETDGWWLIGNGILLHGFVIYLAEAKMNGAVSLLRQFVRLVTTFRGAPYQTHFLLEIFLLFEHLPRFLMSLQRWTHLSCAWIAGRSLNSLIVYIVRSVCFRNRTYILSSTLTQLQPIRELRGLCACKMCCIFKIDAKNVDVLSRMNKKKKKRRIPLFLSTPHTYKLSWNL